MQSNDLKKWLSLFVAVFMSGGKLRKSLRLKLKQLDVFGIRIWLDCSDIVLKELTGTLIYQLDSYYLYNFIYTL